MTDSDNHYLAQAVHDLGSALWFGGTVMGVAGVNKSGSDLTQGIDRIRVASAAWRRFAPAQWAGIGATLLAGLRLTQVGGRRVALQQGFGTVGAVKAGIAVAGAGASAYAAYSGGMIGKLAEESEQQGRPLEVKDATIPMPTTPSEIATWQRRQRVAQFVVPVLAGANIVCNSWLVQSYRAGSTLKGVARRLLPD
jgi:putative copper export protein